MIHDIASNYDIVEHLAYAEVAAATPAYGTAVDTYEGNILHFEITVGSQTATAVTAIAQYQDSAGAWADSTVATETVDFAAAGIGHIAVNIPHLAEAVRIKITPDDDVASFGIVSYQLKVNE